MAKLGTYYGLCPLIDQESLLGVCENSDTGKVIVTLGKNIAIKYKISDQKQLHSWRTKDKFSSPVIFDKQTQKYAAVFNQSYMRVWSDEIEYLDKVTKYKFNKTIYTLITCNSNSYIVFKNGSVVELNYAIDNRKILEIEDIIKSDSELSVVTACLNDDVYIGLLAKTNEKNLFVCNILCGDNKKEIITFDLERESHPRLSGLMLTGRVVANTKSIHLLSLWSDRKLFSCPIYKEDEDEINPQGEMFALVESISCKQLVTMVPLNDNYIAMYGADFKEEGASLILYNIQFKVSQSQQQLKLYTPRAKLWKIGNNILLPVGLHLAVIPFHLDTELLGSLVGSHRTNLADLDPDVMIVEDFKKVNWNTNKEEELELTSVPLRVKNKVLQLAKQGLPEPLICEQLLPNFMEKNDFQSIEDCLNSICVIPELYIARLLKVFLTVDSSAFKKSHNIPSKSLPSDLQPAKRCNYVDRILILPFSDVLLLPHIRKELDITWTLRLLQYICYLMSEGGHTLPIRNVINGDKKLIDWGSLLLDANYQNFLLSKDKTIIETLRLYKKVVEDFLKNRALFEKVLPLMHQVKSGKILPNQQQKKSQNYNIINEKIF